MFKFQPTPKRRCQLKPKSPKNVDSTEGLIDMCKKHIKKYMTGVEIGCFRGKSSEVLAFYCKTLTCVDPWDKAGEKGFHWPKKMLAGAEKEFDKMLKNNKNIIKKKTFSLEYARKISDESLDFVYIDGRHDYKYAKADIIAWAKKVKPGGIISGHDYNLIKKVIKDLELNVVLFKDSSWMYYKN